MKKPVWLIVFIFSVVYGLGAQNIMVQVLEALRLYENGDYNAVIKLLAPLDKPENTDNPLYSAVVQHLAYSAYSTMNYALAIDSFEKLKNIQERTLGREHPGYALTLNNLGTLYQDIMRDYGRATSYYLEAKTIWEKALGREDPHYIKTLSNLGLLYEAQGDYTQAESYFLEAKAIQEKTVGREHPDYVALVNNLKAFYRVIGREYND
jgi:tetratricopeptide (TPR) repeat protein